VGRCGLDASGSGYGRVVGPYGHGNGSLGSIKGMEFDYECLLASQEGLCSMELVGGDK